jgi:hypothetical protein
MRTSDVEAMATTFEADLARANLPHRDVVEPAAARVAELGPIATRVFGRWADLVSSRV